MAGRNLPDDHFSEPVAARFDARYAYLEAPAIVDPIVTFLEARARGGPALELGSGTGRIALRLAARGLPVHGIELSEAMTARLRSKPGGHGVEVTTGDFATARVEGEFMLVYVVANTIMNLTAQDAQVACFANAARHLAPGGCFVVEVLVPGLRTLPPGQRFQVFDVGPGHIGVDEYDVAHQGLVSHHVWIEGDRADALAPPFRYVWPSELDLMARLAGMGLRERWGGWAEEPFTSESTKHVSVWATPG